MSGSSLALLIVGYAASVVFSCGAVNADLCAFYDDISQYMTFRRRQQTRRQCHSLMLFCGLACTIPVINVVFALGVSRMMRAGWSLTRRPAILSEAA